MLLEKLCNAAGPSGYEGEVRKIIIDELNSFTKDLYIDKMGNIIVHKRGQGPKVMITAHMDEIGLIITGYNKDGTLRFSTLGQIDREILPCKLVLIGEKKIPGVIGLKPIHLQSKKERNRNVSYEMICIDIGVESEEEAKKLIKLGDFVVFNTEFSKFGDNLIKAKAINNRIGCALLIDLLRREYKCDLYGVFNVQENIGQRGAYISSYNITPDVAIILDTINSMDLCGISHLSRNSELGKGPVIPFKGGTLLFDRDIVLSIRTEANNLNISYQKVSSTEEEGDARAIQVTKDGARVGTVLIPCRYMNSNVSICSLCDYDNTLKLLESYLNKISL